MTLRWDSGREREITVRPGETVLEAADRVDVGLPYGCRTGACATCTGRVLDASGVDYPRVREVFDYRRPPRALDAEVDRDGYVLLCVAEPTTACRLAVGAAVLTELFDNPWK